MKKLSLPLVLLLCILACLGINFVMGKDLNADLLAYHLYIAHMFATGGYQQEFMGAGLQSFFNPVGYLPFYWMIKAGWPSLLIGSIMAAIHALNPFMLWLIGRDFLFRDSAYRVGLSTLGLLLGLVSPVFVAVLGSSFLDPIQSGMMLAGLYLLLCSLREQPGKFDLIGAGLLLGAAIGLKPTVAGVAVFSMLGLAWFSWRQATAMIAVRKTLHLTAGLAVGGLATGGYWALHLWNRFGSPVFPFANDLFKAPDFYPVALTTDRFIANSLWEVLAFPFRMSKINSGIYVEIAAPDLRFALLLLLIGAWMFARWRRAKSTLSSAPGSYGTAAVPLLWLIFTCGVLLWMAKLGNGRYHVMYLLLAGPLLVWVLHRLMGDRKQTLLAAGLILALQFAHGLSMGYPRWESASWTRTWIKTWWPADLPQAPGLYLQVGPGIDTAIFAGFPADSRFIDLGGKFPVPPESPPGRRISKLLSDSNLPRYVMFKSRASDQKFWLQARSMNEATVVQIDLLLQPWNLRMKNGTCHPVEVELDRDEMDAGGATPLVLGEKRYALLVCPVAANTEKNAQMEMERAALGKLAQQLTEACPKLFPAPASLPTQLAGVWNIRYIGTDIVVALHNGELTYSKYPHGPFNVAIGVETKSGLPAVDCVSGGRAW